MTKKFACLLMGVIMMLSCTVSVGAQNNVGSEPEEECVDTIAAYPSESLDINAMDVSVCEEIAADPRQIVGGTDSRVKVTSVTSDPFYAIAALYVVFPDGEIARATGYMISERYMLTAAHVVYDCEDDTPASSVTAYFGRNGSTYSLKRTAYTWHYCVGYPENESTEDDWAIIEFSSNVGNTTGWFDLNYTPSSVYSGLSVTVTGYPNDKSTTNTSADDGYNRYMYTAAAAVDLVDSTVFSYNVDTEWGESGAPIYRVVNSSYIAYGVHHGISEDNTNNEGRRITSALYNSWLDKGWISE